MKIIEILADGIIFQSRGEARRAVQQGAIKINNILVKDAEMEVGDLCSTCIKPTTVTKGKKVFVIVDGKTVGAQG